MLNIWDLKKFPKEARHRNQDHFREIVRVEYSNLIVEADQKSVVLKYPAWPDTNAKRENANIKYLSAVPENPEAKELAGRSWYIASEYYVRNPFSFKKLYKGGWRIELPNRDVILSTHQVIARRRYAVDSWSSASRALDRSSAS